MDERPQSDLIPEAPPGPPLSATTVHIVLILSALAAVAIEYRVVQALRESDSDETTTLATLLGLSVFGVAAGIFGGALRWRTSVNLVAIATMSAAAVAIFARSRHWAFAEAMLAEFSVPLAVFMAWPGTVIGEGLSRRAETGASELPSPALLERVPSSHRDIIIAVRLRRRQFTNLRGHRRRIRRILALRILRRAA